MFFSLKRDDRYETSRLTIEHSIVGTAGISYMSSSDLATRPPVKNPAFAQVM